MQGRTEDFLANMIVIHNVLVHQKNKQLYLQYILHPPPTTTYF